MNNVSTKNSSKTTNVILLMFACMLFSNVTVFGQTAEENKYVKSTTIENKEIVNNNAFKIGSMEQEAVSNASNMNFVLWFMGSKQSPNATIMSVGTTAKKQFMTSGTSPNRLLIKAFLKKAVNFESAVV